MSNQIIYTKEVTYEFSYGGNSTYEHHYVDNILNLRFRAYNDDFEYNLPQPLTFIGTGQSHQNINAVLVGERASYEDDDVKIVELLFLLPDVNRYVQLEYREEVELGEVNVMWGIVYINIFGEEI